MGRPGCATIFFVFLISGDSRSAFYSWNFSLCAFNAGANSVDVVYDCIGEAGCADHALEILRPGGSFVSIMFQKPVTPREDVKCGVFINSDTNLDNLEQLDALKLMVTT